MIAAVLLALMVPADLSGTVFLDRNGNGVRDAGEPGIAGVAVSDEADVVTTDQDGTFRIAATRGFGIVFVSVPNGYRAVGSFWRNAAGPLEFALAAAPVRRDFVFVHASDTHISAASLARTRRFRELADSIRPDFVIVTGDLVRDALRVGEQEATGYYEMFAAEAAQFSAPLWTVPGHHEIFGIERARSNVSPDHPLFGRAMYRHYRGPDYYSFTYGGIHFVGLNSVDIDDQWYYGHVDSVQLAWLANDLALVPATMPVITFNHIPFFTAVETINGYTDTPPAPSAITVRGHTSFRHSVSNAADVIACIAPHPFPLALGGHMHTREQLRYEGVFTRFFQTAAVVGPSTGAGLTFPSGIVIYRVHAGTIDDGTLVPLDRH
jgi:hypothetical protein